MLQAAWYGVSIKEERCWRHFEVKLPSETVYVAVWRENGWDDALTQKLGDFARKHLATMDSVAAEDVELMAATLVDMAGADASVFIASVGTRVMYGVRGGVVWLAKGEKRGYLADRPKMVVVYSGEVEADDQLVLGLGDNCEKMIESIEQTDEVVSLIEKMNSGLLLVIRRLPVEKGTADVYGEKDFKKPFHERVLSWFNPTPHPQIYVKNLERKRLGLLVAGMFVLLLLSVVLGWYKRQSDARAEAFAAVYEPTLTLLIEAEKQMGENPLMSRDKLLSAQQSLAAVMGNYDKKSNEYQKLTTLSAQVDELYQKVSGEMKLTSVETYFDLTVVSEGMWGSKMATGDGWVVVLDTTKGLVVGIEAATKQAKILAGGEILTGARFISASTGKAIVSANGGLIGLYYGDRKPEKLKENDETWQDIGALGMFGGNVYLATSVGDIWHYPGFDGGLGERRRWLGPGVVPNLTNVTSMAVDGDIWLSTKSGGIMHFRRGAPMNVNLKGLAVPLGEVGSIYAEYEKEEFWVLDKTNTRLVAFGKDGTYKRQIQWDGLSSVSDMVVITDKDGGGIILLLSGSTIYQIPITN